MRGGSQRTYRRCEHAKLGEESSKTLAAEVIVVRLVTAYVLTIRCPDSGFCINREQQILRWLSVLPDDGRYAAAHFTDLCPGVPCMEHVTVEYEDVRRKIANRN